MGIEVLIIGIGIYTIGSMIAPDSVDMVESTEYKEECVKIEDKVFCPAEVENESDKRNETD